MRHPRPFLLYFQSFQTTKITIELQVRSDGMYQSRCTKEIDTQSSTLQGRKKQLRQQNSLGEIT